MQSLLNKAIVFYKKAQVANTNAFLKMLSDIDPDAQNELQAGRVASLDKQTLQWILTNNMTPQYLKDTCNQFLIKLQQVKTKPIDMYGKFMDKPTEQLIVTKVQKYLKSRGFDIGKFGPKLDGIDGRFGESTYNALLEYQKRNNLPVNGTMNFATLKSMNITT